MNQFGHIVVVIDDDPVIREIVSFNLKLRGFAAYSFSNGIEALKAIESIKPDLVILDVIMPDMDGWEICKILRDTDETLKILMLTALDTDRDKMIGRSILHADEYMTKPFDLDELIESVKRLVEK